MATVELGKTGITVNSVGFGAMRLGRSKTLSDHQSSEIIREIVNLGADFIDTADAYCLSEETKHRNEKQIYSALTGFEGSVVIATKGGMICFNDTCIRYGEPKHIKKAIFNSHQALGGKAPIQLWQYHQYDRNFPLEETFAPVKEAMAAGLIQHVGVSNFSLDDLKRVRRIVDITTVQNEYNLWVRSPEETGLLKYCEEQQITLIAWRPLGGMGRLKSLPENHIIRQIAHQRKATVAQVVLAWLLARSPRVLAIPGTTSPTHFRECFDAQRITLTPDELKQLSEGVKTESPQIPE